MKSRLIHWFAMILILEIGVLHLLNAQAEYEEAAYMGYLFMANFCSALVAGLGLYRQQVWGWRLGMAISATSMALYAWSRTLGMPGMPLEEWFSPYGIAALSVEALFLALSLFRPWRYAASATPLLADKDRFFASLAGLIVIASIGYLAYRWDQSVTQTLGSHVGSLAQVRGTREISYAKLEADYGIQVSLVAISMMNSIVDVRIKIIDPDKAHAILQNQAALLVDQQALILAPHMHSHNTTRLKAGKIFTVFFPTGQIVSRGAKVSLVFGPIRIEPTVVE